MKNSYIQEINKIVEIPAGEGFVLPHRYVLPAREKGKEKNCRVVLRCLTEDFRMTLTTMSRNTRLIDGCPLKDSR